MGHTACQRLLAVVYLHCLADVLDTIAGYKLLLFGGQALLFAAFLFEKHENTGQRHSADNRQNDPQYRGLCRGRFVAAIAIAVVCIRPVGVNGGIDSEYGICCDLCSTFLFGVPAVEAVFDSGSIGQRAELLVGSGHTADRGCAAIAVKGDYKLGRGILLKDCLYLYIAVRHGELIVLDGHTSANDLPLLEVIAAVRRGGQGDFRSGSRLGGRCKSRTVFIRFYGDVELVGCGSGRCGGRTAAVRFCGGGRCGVRQLPERCLSRQAGIVRYCLRDTTDFEALRDVPGPNRYELKSFPASQNGLACSVQFTRLYDRK